jgi:4-cresol dehydrogenase (hydroxylating) flavoprotein subunit
VSPANTKHVREVVKIANKFGVPLFPIATGRNLGYGTYFDLYEYLRANAPTLMLDCPDLGWGSPSATPSNVAWATPRTATT